MSLIDAAVCETSPSKRKLTISTDRLGVFFVFAGAVAFHLAVIFNLLPSA
ncbi:hypothetical protein [Phyllobacterium sp. SB3]